MGLSMVEPNDADRPQYLARYRPCAGVEVVWAEECVWKRDGYPPSPEYAVRTNRFSVSPSRFGSVVRPFIDDTTEAYEFKQSER
jgi:hypothetical protein